MSIPQPFAVRESAQELLAHLPRFRGDLFLDEKTTAMEMVQRAQYVKSVRNVSDVDMIMALSMRFEHGSAAAMWWEATISEANMLGVTPYHGNWQEFRDDFVAKFTGPDACARVRIKLRGLHNTGNVSKYIATFRALVARLASLGQPMNQHDQVMQFATGLRDAKLIKKVNLHHSLEDAIKEVQSCVTKDLIVDLVQRRGSRYTALNHVSDAGTVFNPDLSDNGDDTETTDYEDADEGWQDPEDNNFELHNLQMRSRRGKFNKDRNDTRGGTRGAGRERGADYGGRARGGRPRGVPRRRDDTRERRPLTEQHKTWFREGKCLKCGSAGHMRKDCTPSGNASPTSG
jgi:hypothetical protein